MLLLFPLLLTIGTLMNVTNYLSQLFSAEILISSD